MPYLTIQIDEQQEAKILQAIRNRQHFRIEGGRVNDGEKMVFLKAIAFTFLEDNWENLGRTKPVETIEREGRLE